jgi:hypothetical protein
MHLSINLSMPNWFDFLRIEAEIALTMVCLAKNHWNLEHSSASVARARTALDEIRRRILEPEFKRALLPVRSNSLSNAVPDRVGIARIPLTGNKAAALTDIRTGAGQERAPKLKQFHERLNPVQGTHARDAGTT